MKRYQFALESVRRVRRIEEDLAKAALLDANHRVTLARQDLATRYARYANMAMAAYSGPTSAFIAERERWGRAGEDVALADGRLYEASATAADRRLRYTDAARRLEVLDRLDERRREEHALDAARAEEREVDDIVVGRAALRRHPSVGDAVGDAVGDPAGER